MKITENGIDLLGIIETIINIKVQLGNDTGLLSDTAAKLMADFCFVLLEHFKHLLWLGRFEKTEMYPCNAQVGRDLHLSYRYEMLAIPVTSFSRKEIAQFFLY